MTVILIFLLLLVPTTTTKKERTNGFKWSKCRNFLLECDSGIYANGNKDNFEKYGAEVNLNIPICKYEEDHQCRFFGVCEKNPC